MKHKINKKMILAIAICVGLMAWIFLMNSGEKPFSHLKSDHLAAIEIRLDEKPKSKSQKNDNIATIIEALKKVKTFNNAARNEVPSEKYEFVLIYEDGRERNIALAADVEAGKVTDLEKNPCISVNKRWYRIKADQAEELYKLWTANAQ